MRQLLRQLALLLIIVLSGCATRSSQTEMAPSPDSLAERDVARLIAIWQEELCRYIAQEGSGEVEVLSELRGLHSRNVLRPARITFGVLDAAAEPPEQPGWDVQGVLVGLQKNRVVARYVFVVGIVGRGAYLPTKIQDIRVVGMSPQSGTLVWETSAADPAAVQRYRETYSGPGASRFPADDDNFRMNPSHDLVLVREMRSGAEWSLKVGGGEPARYPVAYSGPSSAGGPIRGCRAVE